LTNDLEDCVLQECLTRDVERKVFRVHNTLDKVEVCGDKVLTITHDEHAADIELMLLRFFLDSRRSNGALASHDMNAEKMRIAYEDIPRWDEEDGLGLKLLLPVPPAPPLLLLLLLLALAPLPVLLWLQPMVLLLLLLLLLLPPPLLVLVLVLLLKDALGNTAQNVIHLGGTCNNLTDRKADRAETVEGSGMRGKATRGA
jgi:hypothetical protein